MRRARRYGGRNDRRSVGSRSAVWHGVHRRSAEHTNQLPATNIAWECRTGARLPDLAALAALGLTPHASRSAAFECYLAMDGDSRAQRHRVAETQGVSVIYRTMRSTPFLMSAVLKLISNPSLWPDSFM